MSRGRESTRRNPAFLRATAAAMLLASVSIHLPLGRADFSLDDRDFIQVNETIRSLPSAWRALLSPFPPDQPERGLYRPVTNLSYAFDHAAWGEAARGFHLTQVALYALVVLLVYALALRYRLPTGAAFAVALLFSLHPVHTAAVDALAGRSELLALLFGLLALLLFLGDVASPMRGRAALLASGMAFALALGSKETAAVLPGVLALHGIFFVPAAGTRDRACGRRVLQGVALHAVVLVGYLAIRSSVLGRFSPEDAVLAGQPLETRLSMMGRVAAETARLLVYPSTLQVDFYYQDRIGIPEKLGLAAGLGWGVLLGVLAVLGLLVVRHFRSRAEAPDGDGRGTPWAAVGIVGLGSTLVFLLPVSHVFDIGAVFAERFLFAPSLGFVICVVSGAYLLLQRFVAADRARRALAMGLLAGLAVAGGWRSFSRAAEWRDHVRLWEVTAAAIPQDTRAHLNLGAALLERGEAAAARVALERALDLEPANLLALGNLGVVQMQEGDPSAAVGTYQRLVELAPDNAIAWHNLGLAEAQRLRHSEALRYYDRSLAVNPNFAPAHESRARSEEVLVRARTFLARERSRDEIPADPVLLNDLAAACVIVGDYACAEDFAARRDALGARGR